MKPAMTLTGDGTSGWIWKVTVGTTILFESERMATMDLAAALHQIQRDSHRRSSFFDDATDSELFDLLVRFFYGGYDRILASVGAEETWAKHLVSPPIPAKKSLRMFLVERGEASRLLVGNQALEFSLEAPTFESELRDIRKKLEHE